MYNISVYPVLLGKHRVFSCNIVPVSHFRLYRAGAWAVCGGADSVWFIETPKYHFVEPEI